MTPVLALSLQALQHDMALLDRAATHLAHAQATGWRRAVAVVQAQPTGDTGAGDGERLRIDARPGVLRPTGQALDLAIGGAGWFEVQGPQGPAYTRRGDFRLDGQGRLVTAQGHAVLGTSGEIRLTGSSAAIDAQGHVFDADQPGRTPADAVARLRIVQFEPQATATRGPDSLLHFEGSGTEAADPQVRQGWLEGSNVQPMHEMLQLMQVLRHAQTVQRVASGWDETLGAAIRRLGETS